MCSDIASKLFRSFSLKLLKTKLRLTLHLRSNKTDLNWKESALKQKDKTCRYMPISVPFYFYSNTFWA